MDLEGGQPLEALVPNAQVSALGAMLIDDRTVPILMRTLKADCFPDASYRHVFEAIRQLWSEQRPVDPTTVLETLGGGQGYEQLLRGAMELTPTAKNCETYAELLCRAQELRAIKAACFEIATNTLELSEARQKLAQAAQLLVSGHERLKRFSYAELVTLFIDRMNDATPPDRLDFGIEALNRRVRVSHGDFVILGAYSSVGKTAFALQLARAVGVSGKKVGFYSYETNEEHAGDRLMANAARIRLENIKNRQLTDEDWGQAMREGERSARVDLTLIESASLRAEDLRADILAHGYEVVFLDYVQIVPGGGRNRERKDIVAETSMTLHLLCQELNVTVIALSQVTLPEKTTKGDRRWITMQDLRESKQLLQDAETILLMDLENPLDRNSDRVLIVDKNKDGPVGHFFLRFDADHMRFNYREEPDTGSGQPSRRHQGPKYEQATFEELDDDDGEIPF